MSQGSWGALGHIFMGSFSPKGAAVGAGGCAAPQGLPAVILPNPLICINTDRY